MPHKPTSAQLSQLKVLQNAQAAANARLNSAEAAVAAARASLADALAGKQGADDAVVQYQSFIHGGIAPRNGSTLDEGLSADRV
jgi:hypothetical protein